MHEPFFFFFLTVGYFFRDSTKPTAPIPITATPTSGDQLRSCGFSLEISIPPKSTTFSLVKNVKAVKMVNPKPSSIIKILMFFILFIVYVNMAFEKISQAKSDSPCLYTSLIFLFTKAQFDWNLHP